MYPDYKIGFSKFGKLRPKWSITVNSSRTHCVYVCTYHQNAELICLFLSDNQYNYGDQLKLCVCAVEDCNCLTKQNAWQNNYHQHLRLFLTATTSILIVPYLISKWFQLTELP